MAISRVGGSGAVSTVSNGSSLPISYTPSAAGNLLTISLAIVETGTLSAPTVADSSSTAWTVKNFQKPTDVYFAAHAYRENIPSGLTSVTATLPGLTYARGQVSEWSGVATSSAYDATAGNVTASAGAAATLASGNITSSGTNSLILGVVSNDDSSGTNTFNTTLGSFTQLYAQTPDANGGGGQAIYQIASGSAGPFSVTWSMTPGSGNGWASLFIAFLPAAAGVTTLPVTSFVQPWMKSPGGNFLVGVMPAIIFPPSSLPTITGTLAYTNNNDTLAGSGTSTVNGTLAYSNNNDTLAAAGKSTVIGTLGYTNNNDTLAASGTAGAGNNGTLAYTNNNDTLAGTGAPVVKGTLAATNANDTLAAAGTSTVKGSLAYTNNNDSLAASGKSTVIGTLAASNNNDTLSASGNSGVPPVVTDYWRWIASIQRRIGI